MKHTMTSTTPGTSIRMEYTFSDGTRYVVTSKREGWGNHKTSVRFYAAGDTAGRWSSMAELDRAAAASSRVDSL